MTDTHEPWMAELAVNCPFRKGNLHHDLGTYPVRTNAWQSSGPCERRLGNLDLIELLPQIQQNRGMIVAQVDQALAGNPQMGKLGPFIRAIVNQAINGGELFLKEADAASIGMSLDLVAVHLE